jgi:glycosyltransferase involved in cell wall biosynthesis
MSRKKILWLASWYPNKLAPFDGDFIQRHARAAALYNDIHLIYVVGDGKGIIQSNVQEDLHQSQNLEEQVIYFRRSNTFTGRMLAHYRWASHFKKAVKKYMASHGKPDIVHVHVGMKSGMIALWIKNRYKIPFVVTEHWGIFNDVVDDGYSSKPAWFKKYTQRIFREAIKFISVSKYLAVGINHFVSVKPYEIIPNTVDTKLFFYNATGKGIFRFIHVSNMVPLKNVEGILRAVKILSESNSEFEIVMVGDAGTAIRKYAEELGLLGKFVLFRGEISYAQVAREMQQSNAMILFSNMENSPCVIGEALCCGLPVIATNVGGIPELLDEANGVQVEPKNYLALANAMEQMIINYASYKGEKIAEDAKDRYSYSTIGKEIDEVYNSVLEEIKR